jgi:hypothetical protein
MNISINHILYISLHCPAPARLLRAKGAKVAITSTTDRIFERLEDLGGSQDDSYAKTADLTDSAILS